MYHKKPELVMPGGDLERVKIAFLYGADAVYVGLDKYSLRKAEVRFTIPEIKKAIEHAHTLGKKLYVTFNIFAHDKHLETIEPDLKKIASFGPDAFIVADPGILMLSKKVAPGIPIHLSTQANTINSASVLFWQASGVKRVVLGREITIDELRLIKKTVPDMELEVFVHGAMCVSYSGRCLLSASLTGRSANLGECTQPCRWPYKLKTASHSKASENDIKNFEQSQELGSGGFAPTYFLEEPTRPGQLMEIQEDDKGTYIMNSKDLSLAPELDKVISAGADALKIEGRNKTSYYLAIVGKSYRKAIDQIANHSFSENSQRELIAELNKVTHRPYTTGFMFDEARRDGVFEGRDPIYGKKFVGYISMVTDKKESQSAIVLVKNKITVGRDYELVTPDKNYKVRVLGIFNTQKEKLSEANPGRVNESVKILFNIPVAEKSFMREMG